MLILARHKKEAIVIRAGGREITLTIVELSSNRVRIGFEAPLDVLINRKEIQDAKDSQP